MIEDLAPDLDAARHPQGGVTLRVGDDVVTVCAVTESLMRVVVNRGEAVRPPSIAIVQQPDAAVPLEVTQSGPVVIVSTPAARLEVNTTTGSLDWFRPDGDRFLRLPRRRPARIQPKEVLRTHFDPSVPVAIRNTADGVRASAHGSARLDRMAYEATLDLEFQHQESVFGLGQHDEGILDLRGTHQYLYQQNTKIASPVLVSSRGWALFVDAGSAMTFHDDQHGSFLWADTVEQLDFYVAAGAGEGDYSGLMRQLTLLSGAAPVPPKAVFGYVQSKERYESAEELLDVADEFARRGIHLDVLVLDWKSWPEGLWGQKSLDPERFPDPVGLIDALHERGIKFMVSIWPIMAPGGDNQAEMSASGYLLGNDATYDAFNADARSLYWKQVQTGLFDKGVDYWWGDCSEPFEDDWKGPIQGQPELRFASNLAEFHRYIDPTQANLYSIHHAQGIYEGQRGAAPQRRVVNLIRSAFFGQQRYGTFVWSGDTSATWSELSAQIPAALNLALTGQPYWTCDVGGFFVKTDPSLWFWRGDYPDGVADLGYRELYVRWFQLATFLPMLRAHGTDTPREPWRFGDAGEPFYQALTESISLRARLLPYLYALAAEAHFDGQPLLRHLAFHSPKDPRAVEVRDQFLLGPALMIAPVLEPQAYGPDSTPLDNRDPSRDVYLPTGTDWYDFHDGTHYSGGTTIRIPTTIERIPVFVRAGSIIPTLGDDGALELTVYGGADGSFWLYDDDGETNAYETGAYRRLCVDYDDDRHRLAFHSAQGNGAGAVWLALGHPLRVLDPRGRSATGPDGPRLNLPLDNGELDIDLLPPLHRR